MDPIIIAVIVIACAYPISIAALNFMFKQKYSKRKTVVWNVIILLLPALGAVIYLAAYGTEKLIARKKSSTKTEVTNDGK